nr:unnamed protein product [Digitaria exilis]
MAINSCGGGGAKRQRGDERGVSADRISALPDELRQRILTGLPFKDAIRTGVLARGWRNLWKSRWPHRASVEVHLGSRDDPQGELDALPRPCRRLDRFSLVVDTTKFKSTELRGFTDYAAECRVEDLHVDLQKSTLKILNLHLPLSSPLLARLSLRGIGVTSSMYYLNAQPFRALEVIRLDSVDISQVGFKNMMALCPSLHTLELRHSNCDCFFYRPDSKGKRRRLVMPPNLKTVKVAYCRGHASLNLVPVPSLSSFWYIGDFVSKPFSLPEDAKLIDLYIRIVGEIPFVCNLSRALPIDLSGLTVLTICSNALKIAPSLAIEACPNLSNLQSLKELQLILSRTDTKTLDNIYVFLRASHCHNLERLFVQLPDITHWSLEDLGEKDGPPEHGLRNLRMVKVMRFNWHRFEVQLWPYYDSQQV